MNNGQNPFSFLEDIDISQVSQILQQELPFVSGVALSSMPPVFTAKVMAGMPDSLRGEIAAAMSKYRKIPKDTLYDIAEELQKKIGQQTQTSFNEQKNSILASLDLSAISRNINNLKVKKDTPQHNSEPKSHVESRIMSPEEFSQLQQEQNQPEAHTQDYSQNNTNYEPAKPAPKMQPELDPETARELALQKALRQREDKRRSTKIVPPPAQKNQPEKNYKAQKVDGMALAAHILREADPQLRNMIMAEVPELYNKLNKKMFDFADLERSNKATLGKVFSGLDPKTSALALRFASDSIKNNALTSVSRRKAQLIIDEIKLSADDKVKITAIEDAQQEAIDYAIELQNRGEIIIDPDDSSIV